MCSAAVREFDTPQSTYAVNECYYAITLLHLQTETDDLGSRQVMCLLLQIHDITSYRAAAVRTSRARVRILDIM